MWNAFSYLRLLIKGIFHSKKYGLLVFSAKMNIAFFRFIFFHGFLYPRTEKCLECTHVFSLFLLCISKPAKCNLELHIKFRCFTIFSLINPFFSTHLLMDFFKFLLWCKRKFNEWAVNILVHIIRKRKIAKRLMFIFPTKIFQDAW